MNEGVPDGGDVEAGALRRQEGELEVAEMEMWRFSGRNKDGWDQE